MNKYRVVYGETAPVWDQSFQTWRQTTDFVKRCLDRGDLVFEVRALT